MASETEHTILISPIGDIPERISDTIAQKTAHFFHVKTTVAPLLSDIQFAHDTERNQYHSTVILERLAERCPDKAIRVVAVTLEDLFIPILTHVYGEAQLGGKACIVSIYRLTTGPDLGGMDGGTERIVKEALHELCHTFDLRHCKDPQCVMHYCRKIEDVDRKTGQLCRYCRIFLEDYFTLLDR